MIATITEGTPEGVEAFEKELVDWDNQRQSGEHPLTRKARFRIMADYESLVKMCRPGWPVEDVAYHVGVIREFAPRFLPFMVRISQPRPGRQVIKAITLLGWCNIFIHVILRYTIDPTTMQRCGLFLMTKHDLFFRLRDQVRSLVAEYKLDRHANERLYFGRPELTLMIKAAMAAHKSMRLVKISRVAAMLWIFYCSSRGSTLGPVCKEFIERGEFPKLGEIRVYRKARMDWRMTLNPKQFKKNMTVLATEQHFTMEMAEEPHNVGVCFVLWMMAFLFARRAFKIKYKTLEELFNDESLELEIDPACREEPLFPAAKPGGRDFVYPLVAAMSEAFSDAIANLAQAAGLPRAGVYVFRRDAGNDYGKKVGTEVGELALHHKTSPFRSCYSLGVGNYNLVAIRLQQGPTSKFTTRDFAINSLAVQAQLRYIYAADDLDIDEADPVAAKQAVDAEVTREANKRAEDTPEVVAVKDEEEEKWKAYRACFTDGHNYYKNGKPQLTSIYEIALGIRPTPKGLLKKYPTGISLREGVSRSEMEKCKAELLVAHKGTNKVRKEKRRQEKREDKKAMNKDLRGPKLGTTDQATAALDQVNSNPEFLQKALDGAKNTSDSASASTSQAPASASTNQAPASSRAADDVDFEELGEYSNESYMRGVLSLLSNRTGTTDVTAGSLAVIDMEPPAEEVPEVEPETEVPLDVCLVRQLALQEIVQPIIEVWAEDECKVEGGWRCTACTPFQTRQEQVFPKIESYRKHKSMQHTLWLELELLMYVKGTKEFKCPTCSRLRFASIQHVRLHMISECPEADEYVLVKAAHDKTRNPSRPQQERPVTELGHFHRHNQMTDDDALEIVQLLLDDANEGLDPNAREILKREIENITQWKSGQEAMY